MNLWASGTAGREWDAGSSVDFRIIGAEEVWALSCFFMRFSRGRERVARSGAGIDVQG
jgi:hypothetical protein